ncbi:uncharacterized protein FA14DRAFT_124191 [Meira miltonrushii]|uniref:Enoyl reductase (ER) domain-containing protein n=1 Tax=Meira miltonrushii TaxID=1280837 RepID=A0A316V9L7_9BASI|nr:uncharacterized protein FA14DRAFT_124191 [Meira miltonrushii]PWN34152.1 hypothetical protein FA14DRAFT_124191 [Meira miltonrushii]
MATVQTQPVRSGFSALSDHERQEALSFLLVSDEDAVLDGAWEDRPLAKSATLSPSPIEATSEQSSTSQSSLESSRSPSPSSSQLASPSASLLIRSKCQGWERSFELHQDWPIPTIEQEDEVLIQHKSVGLNPVDYKSVLYNFGIPQSPWVLGRDVCGVVKEVGKNVKHLLPGQRVWTCADSRDRRSGAYQGFSVAKAVHIGLVPDIIQDEQAATLGTGLITAAISAFWFFRWPRASQLTGGNVEAVATSSKDRISASPSFMPQENSPWVLIYGGGAITGIFLAQLARLSGSRVIAVASSSNIDYLTSAQVGVSHCIDRFLPQEEIAEKVRSICENDGGLQFIVDTVGSKTAGFSYDLAANIGTSSSTLPPAQMICLAGDPKNPQKGSKDVIVHRISFSTTFYGDDVFATQLLQDLTKLMQQKQLHPVKYEIVPDGLAGVRKGLERLRDNQAPRACKLIVNVADTPDAQLTHLGVRAELGWNGV